ncbi:hypothetical protein M3Y98_00516500 [Aphelenchoides besseyi]|nr:hypothetical protein M3Y98_00516500 [Aphelenchoides besseyi]KAI6207905.1 hypothetical protein M3Y96_00058400 [Aphelenchoides besseyi]
MIPVRLFAIFVLVLVIGMTITKAEDNFERKEREYRPLQFGKRDDFRPLQFGKKNSYRPLQFGKRSSILKSWQLSDPRLVNRQWRLWSEAMD